MTKKLIPVIAQDARTNDILMLAWADAEALRRSKKTGYMHYWSRSRGKYRDAILARVEQTGPACHKGTATCWTDRPWRTNPALDELLRVFADRKKKPKKGSYTNRLMADPVKLRGKLIEECCELIMATRAKRRKEIAEEAADVLYHFLLLLFTSGVTFSEVAGVLERRRR
jgi:phosphoribosyl-ATP pyrophosphohydrolase/phosphoribosyl-AMP cyclohydrolase